MLLRQLASVTQGIATSGKGAGARQGEWSLHLVESGDIDADGVRLEGLRTINVERNTRTEKHLLRPFDVLVTARSQSVKVALVPPQVTRTVAGSTLLLVRPSLPETGVAHYLWYYLTSRQGRAAVEARVAAVAICVLNKAKRPERRGRILFIDAAQEGYYRQGKAQNFLDQAHIDKIGAAFHAFQDVERFAHVADLDEIRANDYNLNISRYVDTTKQEEVMSVEEALAQLREAERRREEAAAKMNKLLAELGYAG